MTYPLSFVTKMGSSFGLSVVMYLGGKLAQDFLIGGLFITFEGCSEDLCTFFFFLFRYIILLYIGLVTVQ